jgi:hypothetical protein
MFVSLEERDAVVALKIGFVVRGKMDISHLISCWATVERTAMYAHGDPGFVAGYGENNVAGHGGLLLVLGRVGRIPSSAPLLFFFSVFPNLARVFSKKP